MERREGRMDHEPKPLDWWFVVALGTALLLGLAAGCFVTALIALVWSWVTGGN